MALCSRQGLRALAELFGGGADDVRSVEVVRYVHRRFGVTAHLSADEPQTPEFAAPVGHLLLRATLTPQQRLRIEEKQAVESSDRY